MAEELGYEVTVERLVFVVERTFGFLHWDRGNIPCTVHQIAFYYLCTLPPNCPLSDLTVPFTSPEPGNLQTYKWQDVASLPDINLKPDFLRTALQHLPDGITRVTERA
jgi:8-oxo-dGTP pyrophosphatase MutT (NUDIX family)